MAKKRPLTIEACKRRNNRVLWLDHVELIDDDIEWLSKTERLTLWNVKVPAGLLARIEPLWWLDIRGSSAIDLAVANGVNGLQYLRFSQGRGMRDLSLVADMISLRYVVLYSLHKVTELPSCARLVNLEHATIGQMRDLTSLHGLLQAPNLRELELVKKINVSEDDVNGIMSHPAVKAFGWDADGLPDKVWWPVFKKIGLPAPAPVAPEVWFKLPEVNWDRLKAMKPNAAPERSGT